MMGYIMIHIPSKTIVHCYPILLVKDPINQLQHYQFNCYRMINALTK